MTIRLSILSLVISLLAFGCEDDSGRSPEVGRSGDAGLIADSTMTDQGPRDVSDDGPISPLEDMGISMGEEPEPAYVEMTLNRRRPLYTRADRPVVEYTVYDRIGRPISDFPVRLDVQPRGQAVGPDERLNFLEEGAGAVRGCATPDICGRVSFFVDDGPLLWKSSPLNGALPSPANLKFKSMAEPTSIQMYAFSSTTYPSISTRMENLERSYGPSLG